MEGDGRERVARRVAASTVAQLVGRGLVLAAGAVSIVLLTRYLGAAGYGRLGVALSYVQAFGVLADLGLVTVLVRELARGEEGAEELVGSAMTLRLALTGLILALAVGISFLLPYDERVRVAILVLGVPLALSGMNSALIALFQADLRMDLKVVGDVLGRFAGLAFTVLVVVADLGFYAVVAASAVAAAVSLAASARLARRFIRVRLRVDRARWRRLVRIGLPIGATLAVAELLFRVDTVIISLSRPYREVGLYSLAYRVLELATALPGMLLASAFPLLARWSESDPGRAREVLTAATDGFVALGLPLFAGGAILAPEIALLAGGRGFIGAADPLAILLASVALSSINGLCGYALIARGRQRDALRLGLGGLAVNVVLNLALVPTYGIDAAAWVTVATEVALLVGSLVLVHRHFGWWPGTSRPLRALGATALMTAVVWFARDAPVVLAVALGALVYVPAVTVLGGIDRGLIRAVREG